jgi:MFS transporter, ACS family, hexuronate transporter
VQSALAGLAGQCVEDLVNAAEPNAPRVSLDRAPTASRFRWWIVALLFFSTTINYVDRQLFANLIPYFEDELRIGPMDLAYINVAFLLTYGLGMTLVGRFVDRVGVRVGLAITFLLWTVASAGHALVYSVFGFILIRILLGLGEAGNFPASIKAVAEWFPKRERALATGWFNCGSNVGAIVTPLVVPLIAVQFGWRVGFAALSAVGIVWLLFWWRTYRNVEVHPKVSAEELAWIRSDEPDAVGRVRLLTLLGHRQVYATALARFFTEAPWWFYLTWMPKFLSDRYGLGDYERAWAVAVVYLIADFGAVGGGWISSRLLKRGHTTNVARKIGLLIAALGTLPVIAVPWLEPGSVFLGIPAVWITVSIVALAASSHQAWSSNIYTVTSDTLPKGAVATAIGVSQAFGAVGSSLFQLMVAVWLVQSGNYTLPFLLAGTLYLVGLAALHLVLPRLEIADIQANERSRIRVWHLAVGAAILAGGLFAVQALLALHQYPYRSRDDYFEKRQTELRASAHVLGPTAQVGWQEALWVRWTLPSGDAKFELVKFDTNGRPILEPKGASAKKYKGPSPQDVAAQTPTNQP